MWMLKIIDLFFSNVLVKFNDIRLGFITLVYNIKTQVNNFRTITSFFGQFIKYSS